MIPWFFLNPWSENRVPKKSHGLSLCFHGVFLFFSNVILPTQNPWRSSRQLRPAAPWEPPSRCTSWRGWWSPSRSVRARSPVRCSGGGCGQLLMETNTHGMFLHSDYWFQDFSKMWNVRKANTEKRWNSVSIQRILLHLNQPVQVVGSSKIPMSIHFQPMLGAINCHHNWTHTFWAKASFKRCLASAAVIRTCCWASPFFFITCDRKLALSDFEIFRTS